METYKEAGSVGLVQTQYVTFAEPPYELLLESGQRLGPITLAYETYGTLKAADGKTDLNYMLMRPPGVAPGAKVPSPFR